MGKALWYMDIILIQYAQVWVFFLSVTNKTEDKGPRAQVFVTARAKWTDDHYAYTSDTVPDNWTQWFTYCIVQGLMEVQPKRDSAFVELLWIFGNGFCV